MFGLPADRVLLVGLGALLAGVLVAWGTTQVPGMLAAPEVTASPTPSPTPIPTENVEVPLLAPILRDLDEADAEAGVTTLDFTYQGEGTFSVVEGEGTPYGDAPIRWVAIFVEDGVSANPTAFSRFVMRTLNETRGWGAENRMQFVQTDGVADYRIRLASPFTAAALCADSHVAAVVGPVVEATAAAEPETTIEPTSDPSLLAGEDLEDLKLEGDPACAHEGEIIISVYDWTAGFPAFGADRTAARQYLLNHHIGHLFGHEEAECTGGRAGVMADQRGEMPCEPNPWPYPDVVTPDES